jgi:hypothetical protein
MPCSANCPFCAPQPTQDARAIAALRGDVAGLRLLLHAALDVAASSRDELTQVKRNLAEARDEIRRYTQDAVAPGRAVALSSGIDAPVTEA